MFAGYAAPSEVKEENNPSTSKAEDDPGRYSTFDKDKIMKERKKKEEAMKTRKMIEKAKEGIVYRAYKLDDSDEDSDGPSVPVEQEAITEHLNGLLERRLKKIKKPSSSSSDSEKDHKKSKKRKRDRDRKKRHRNRSSSSSDSDHRRRRSKRARKHSGSEEDVKPAVAMKHKYSFMIQGDTVVNLYQDKVSDDSNFQYDGVYSHHRSSCYMNYPLLKTPGQPNLMDKIFVPSRLNYQGPDHPLIKHSMISEKPIKFNARKREHQFLEVHFPYNCDFIKLSQDPFTEFRFLHEIEAEREQMREVDEMSRKSMTLASIEEEKKQLNRELHKDPRNAALYHKFLELEDLHSKFLVESGSTTDAQYRTSNNERKLAILENAIKNCPRDIDLKVMRINILIEEGHTDKVASEWKTLLNIFPNRCQLWAKYLDYIQNSSSQYSSSSMERAFNLCDEKLAGLLTGKIRSHEAEEGTADFQFTCFLRRLKWLLCSGFTERAIACIQATIDIFCSGNFEDRTQFQAFWNSKVARFGDVGGRGFVDFEVETKEERIMQVRLERAENEKLNDERDGFQRSITESKDVTFATYERQMSELYIRPGRNVFDDESEYTNVDYSELFVHNIFGDSTRLPDILSHLGSVIYSHSSANMREPGFYLALDLNVDPPYQDFPVACLDRLLLMMKNSYSVFGDSAMQLLCSTISTKARLLIADGRKTDALRFKELGTFLGENMKILGENMNIGTNEDYKYLFLYFGFIEMSRFCSAPSLEKKWKDKVLLFVENLRKQLTPSNEGNYRSLVLKMFYGLLVSVAEVQSDADVGPFITRCILDLDHTTEVSPIQYLDAKQKLRNMCAVGVSKMCEHAEALLEDHVVFCQVLLMYLDYSGRSTSNTNWIQTVRSEYVETELGRNNYLIQLAYLDLLLRQRKHGNCNRHLAIDQAIECVQRFPQNKRIWKKFSDVGLECHKLSKDRLRLCTLQNDFGEYAQDMYCLSKMRWALKDRENSEAPCKLALQRAEATSDPFWWRMAMKYANGSVRNDIYVRASNNCRWSKQLHLDMYDESPVCTEMQILEAEIRMVSNSDEYKTLREAGGH